MLAELDDIEQTALQALQAVEGEEGLESWRIAWLGSKGELKTLMPRLKEVPKEEKPATPRRRYLRRCLPPSP